MTAPRRNGMAGHESQSAGTVEWLTPLSVINKLGPFDLDPCHPTHLWPTAERWFTRIENGLLQRWWGRVWMNPPYASGEIDKWMARLADHGRGTALIFARTETDSFFEYVWYRATALLFLRGRMTFHVGEPYIDEDGRRFEFGDLAPGNAGAPSVFCAYGDEDAGRLASAGFDGVLVRMTEMRARPSSDQLALWEAFDAPV